MIKYFFAIVSLVTLSPSLVFAMLDKDFHGNILVHGGTTKGHPGRLSINTDGSGDIKGNSWDEDFLENNFTKGKYNHTIYEHVGYSLTDYGKYMGADEYPRASRLATIHFNLLKSGGTFDFLTWGDVFNNYLTFVGFHEDSITQPLGEIYYTMQRLSKDGVVFRYDEEGMKLIAQNHKHNYDNEIPGLVKTLEILNNHGIITKTVPYLAYAGFKDICVAFEKDGILGFTQNHHSLHISAKKPN